MDMQALEQLWVFMEQDVKADRMEADIRNSPLRQDLEKKREFILSQQEAYKKLEEQMAISTDRKDALLVALEKASARLDALLKRIEELPEDDLEATQALTAEVAGFVQTIEGYRAELQGIQKAASEASGASATLRIKTAQAKQEFDRKKQLYNEGLTEKKAALLVQREAADRLAAGIPDALMQVYRDVKKHISPPMAELRHGQCGACFTGQPSAKLRKLELGQELVTCETCGRILIVPRPRAEA